MKTSVHVFFSPILNESRLSKTCSSILQLKLVDKVIVIGIWDKGLKDDETFFQNCHIKRIKMLIKQLNTSLFAVRFFARIYSIFQFYIKCISEIYKIKPSYISCHNLQLLPLCAFCKFIISAKLLYEPHELETEKTGISKIEKRIAVFIEFFFIKYTDKVITVCEPITDFYTLKYRLKKSHIYTVRNVPVNPGINVGYNKSNILRQEFSIPETSIIYIYQGLIDKYRGIKNYLDTFSKLNQSHQLVVMGYGDEEKLVQEYAAMFSNIHFKKAVPVDEIIRYTSSADVGLFIIPGELSLSYKYALPNKFYEYAIAGLHICVSDNFVYLKEIVQIQSLGNVICSNERCLYDWISNSDLNRSKLLPNEKSYQIRKAIGWQNEEQKYLEIYKQ